LRTAQSSFVLFKKAEQIIIKGIKEIKGREDI